jgi:hypothetical protein
MTRRAKVFLGVALVLCFSVLVGWTSAAPGRQQWEYRVIFIPSSQEVNYHPEQEIPKILNGAEADGWELVQVVPHGDSRSATGLWYFRRPK